MTYPRHILVQRRTADGLDIDAPTPEDAAGARAHFIEIDRADLSPGGNITPQQGDKNRANESRATAQVLVFQGSPLIAAGFFGGLGVRILRTTQESCQGAESSHRDAGADPLTSTRVLI